MTAALLAAVATALAVVLGRRPPRRPPPHTEFRARPTRAGPTRADRARADRARADPTRADPTRADPTRAHVATVAAALAAWSLAGPRAGPLAALAVAAGAHRLFAALPSRAAAELDRARAAAVPLFADLVAACLAAGASPDAAVDAAAHAVPGPLGDAAAHAVRATRLGVPAATAWAPLLARDRPASVRALARALARSADSGAAPAHVLRAIADDARAAARTAGEAAARRAAVAAVLPLGLCFLPAFVLAGVVPLVAGLLAHTL